jgi:hypothetical protein
VNVAGECIEALFGDADEDEDSDRSMRRRVACELIAVGLHNLGELRKHWNGPE